LNRRLPPASAGGEPDDDAGSHGIVVALDDVLVARGMTLTELSRRIGIALPNLSILKTGKGRAIRFSTLAAICRTLECQPGDVLRYEPPE
jgi:putative transcriptional regulator